MTIPGAVIQRRVIDFGYMNQESDIEEDLHPGLVSKFPSKVEKTLNSTSAYNFQHLSSNSIPRIYTPSSFLVEH